MSNITQKVAVIGPKELVDFPNQGLLNVPAKVDTGADSSAIWASDIREENGVLYFVLFDKISPFYTGEILKSEKFSVASIKNSFGQTEFRYKVSLKVRLAGRLLNVRFTLANRENNSQPILIGRRTLHGKFLVDVAAKTQPATARRMLMLSKSVSPRVQGFARGVEQASENLQITYTTYEDVLFSFGPQGTHITLLSTGDDIASFDIVHFKTSGNRDITAAMARYLKKRGVKIMDDMSQHFAGTSKLFQYVILADNEVPVPASLYVPLSHMEESYDRFVAHLELPFVLKGLHASKGTYNYLIRSQADYEEAVKVLQAEDILAVGQRFVPNSGDYRVLVLGRRIALVIHRQRLSDDTHLNNTSTGGGARLVDVSELSTAVQTTCIIAAKVMDLGVAGVDMVQDSVSGDWYCFEVNDGPQIASGAFMKEKQEAFAKYIATELNK